MATTGRTPKSLVGGFLRQRRETLGISQRELGMRFNPTVTTQFISNLERGVTPLPPHHIPTLARELQVTEAELLGILEREYAQKISDRIHRLPADTGLGPATSAPPVTNRTLRSLFVEEKDADLMRAIYSAYSLSDRETKENFVSVCEKILRMTKS